MNKKYFLKNGEEVKLGDVICMSDNLSLFDGDIEISCLITVNEETIPKLLEKGIIEEKGIDIDTILQRMADRTGWPVGKINRCLENMFIIRPASVYSALLKEISEIFNEGYPIEDSPEIYAISSSTGKIIKLNKAHIKSYANFAAFRSLEDVKAAKEILLCCQKRFPNEQKDQERP